MQRLMGKQTNRLTRPTPWLAALASVVLWSGAAQPVALADDAQVQPQVPAEVEQAKAEFSKFLNVDLIMQRAADNIARRYNLNASQREQTQELLTREVTKFLDEHQEIWPLVRDMARLQQAGEQPQGKAAQRLGEKAIPLIREIEDTIIEANMRWRDILTEDQKRVHDFDLQDMAKTFAKMNDNFRTMAEGGPGVAQIFPEPNRDLSHPSPPKAPDPNYKAPEIEPVPREGPPPEHMWDRYVEEFIRDYNLDDSQSEAAHSILRECKQRAQDYRNSKRSEFRQVEERMRDAKRGDQTPEVRTNKLKIWTQIERSLNKPILDLFQELQNRLEPIPTDAQRAHARRLGREVRPVKRTKEQAPAVAPDKPAEPAESPATPPAGESPKPESVKPKAKPADKPAESDAAPADDVPPPD